jgi:hypothetical protein
MSPAAVDGALTATRSDTAMNQAWGEPFSYRRRPRQATRSAVRAGVSVPDSRDGQPQKGGKQLRSRLKDLRKRLGTAHAEWSPGTPGVESTGTSYASRLDKLLDTNNEPEPTEAAKPTQRGERRR